MHVREATPADLEFLRRMFVAAARIDSVDALETPPLARYFADWGHRPGDLALIAETLGAAWWRFFTQDTPGYGFVAENIPELGIAVVREHRGRGVGGQLLRELQSRAVARGLPGLSLSVHRENPARALYAQTGFVEVGENGQALTMLWRVNPPSAARP